VGAWPGLASRARRGCFGSRADRLGDSAAPLMGALPGLASRAFPPPIGTGGGLLCEHCLLFQEP